MAHAGIPECALRDTDPDDDKRLRLLVVDDQPTNIQVIYQIFSATYAVFVATSGSAALAMCQENPPDLVLLDVIMPGMDGLELCRQLKRHDLTSNIPVIFVTAGRNTTEENACWEAGGVDFVSKPINPLTLRNRVRVHLTLKRQADALRDMAFIDGLTGIANRRQFDDRLARELSRSKRSGQCMALLLADVDFFKRYNDRYGHQAGDHCLREVAKAVQATLLRPGDLTARYGGEEFACILPDTSPEGAMQIGTALEIAVRNLQIEHLGSDAASVVSISVGIAAGVAMIDSMPDDLIALADAQLYRAKQRGRARIEFSAFNP